MSGIRPHGGQTHTFVKLALSAEAYIEIRNKLAAAGYEHAFDGDCIDMQGLAVVQQGGPEDEDA